MPQSKVKRILALDLGGTKIRSAIVLSNGEIVSSIKYPTQAAKGPESVVERLVFAIKDTLQRVGLNINELNGVVIASAGIIDIRNGIVTASPSLPGWHDIPLRNIISRKLKTKVYLINDASAAALGEHRFGAGKGLNNLVYLTVSTGIGGGIIINGELYDGTDGCAAEIGHMIIEADGPKCNCGSSGCLEVMASGTAIAREAQRRITQGQRSSLIELTKNSASDITAETVAQAAKCGDIVACEVISRAAYYLGIGIANVVNIFNPEMVIIGGGVSKMGDLLLRPARKVVKQKAFKLPASTVRIVRSRLGDNAGILGAAVYVFEKC